MDEQINQTKTKHDTERQVLLMHVIVKCVCLFVCLSRLLALTVTVDLTDNLIAIMPVEFPTGNILTKNLQFWFFTKGYWMKKYR